MFCTPDFKVKEVLEPGKYSGKLKVGVKVPKQVMESFFNSDVTGFSTRSKLARVFTELFPASEVYKEGDEIVAEFEYINYGFPIRYSLGDEIGRFWAYNEEDRVEGKELKEIFSNSPGVNVHSDYIEARLKNNVFYELKKPKSPIRAKEILKNPYKFIEKHEKEFDWFLFILFCEACPEYNGCMLVETEPISIPQGYYAVIKDVTLLGNSWHLTSRVIDPGYKGPVLIEVKVRDPSNIFAKDHAALIEIYKATEP